MWIQPTLPNVIFHYFSHRCQTHYKNWSTFYSLNATLTFSSPLASADANRYICNTLRHLLLAPSEVLLKSYLLFSAQKICYILQETFPDLSSYMWSPFSLNTIFGFKVLKTERICLFPSYLIFLLVFWLLWKVSFISHIFISLKPLASCLT